MCPFLEVFEVYVRWIEIAYSLMWPLIVPVVNELLMRLEHPSLALVRLMKSFDLAYG
jgi:hypothetical protein